MAITTGFQQQGLPPRRPEAEAIRSARIQREEAVIAKAEADLGAGLGIEDDDVEAWLDALEDDPSAPLPDPQKARVTRRVTTAPDALEALRQARAWLTQTGSGPNGRARWEALRDSRKRLRTYPYLGAPIEGWPGRYQLVVSEYRIIYRVDPDTGESATAGDIRVLAVFGPGQP